MEPVNPKDARNALDQAAGARAHVARRAAAPGWYHPAVGCCLLFAFASVSLGYDVIPYGVIIGIGLGPLLLSLLAGHRTGVSVDRYYSTPGVRRISWALVLLVVALIGVGLVLEWVVDLRWAMAVCGVVALVGTVLLGRRMDAVLVEELGGTGERA